MRAVNKVKPTPPPILAVSSDRLFSFSCSGVGLGSPRRAAKRVVLSSSRNPTENYKEHTLHATTIETVLTYSDDDVLAVPFKDFGAGNHETVGAGGGGIERISARVLASGPFPMSNAIFVADLLDSVELPSCVGLVGLDVVAGNEDAITRDDLARLEKGDITDKQFLNVNDAFDTRADHLDATFVLFIAEIPELPFLLPIVEGASYHLRKWG